MSMRMSSGLRALVMSVVVSSALATSACTQRYIVDVVDHQSGKTSLLLTHDATSYLIVRVDKEVFWDCAPDKDGTLQCNRACDRRDEQGAKVLCPKTIRPAW